MDTRITTYSAVLGHVISALRQQQGLQQPALAAALGISQASYSRLEGGKAMWTFDQLISAGQALGVPIDTIHTIFAARVHDLRNTAHMEVIPAGRTNSLGAKNNDLSVGTLVAGAALGAILATLIARK
jgi:transcriptional regulator with XRE-family HTH domain